VEEALSDATDKVLAVYRMRADGGFDRWFASAPDFNTISSLKPYESLFILMGEWGYWTQGASVTPPASVPLASGWNNVCYAGTTNDVQAATTSIAEHIAVLYRLNSDQTWSRYVPASFLNDLDYLESSTGVLILINSGDAIWEFD